MRLKVKAYIAATVTADQLKKVGWLVMTEGNLMQVGDPSDAAETLEADSYTILDAEDGSGPFLDTSTMQKGIGFNISNEEKKIIADIEPLCKSWPSILENSIKLQKALKKLNEIRLRSLK